MVRLRVAVATSLAFAALVALPACKKSGAARLEGHWRGAKVDGVPPQQQTAANVFAAQTEITVKGDAISMSTPTTGKVTSKFKVVKDDKKTVVIVTDADGPKSEESFTFDDDETIEWRLAEGKVVTFRKIPDS